ncbi:tRNA (adenosine(37)-N6)-dimethylallyltransferase MiaA [Clostridium cylindrosporum]|uniref:tRNA dimethylallyltransferase n=1 Tax=Clostridium cylindrosporum DSM 605 TaxID=1121307 RepID=A0A0J8G5Z4_CLOCY|nr:tRNA (adenosine(37)-N6)-dimethylallyltransferase MiaA [Clostridium cylindrosporum]KMT23031.1 tRNA dimethylallyltransferase MiaA [Clostridium cylindrosporum DSM 605]
MKKNLVIIAGPTASGKTATSIEIAKRLNGEIISADSMQVYKYMDIGTAKITEEEMQGVPHYMIDEVTPDMEFSVALFREKAGAYIDDILSRGKLPIVVGGTGLYINSLTYALDFSGAEDKEYREYLENLAKEKGNEYLHSKLKEVDIESYERLFPNDTKRIIRALEVYKLTGKTISEVQRESREKDIDYNLAYITLTMDRETLYERINKRVDIMFEKGLVEEVKSLLNMGYTKDMTSMQAIGYKEVLDYFDGKLTLDEVIYIIKQSSRRYAKRQLTWFRKDKRVRWFETDKYEDKHCLLENIVEYIEGELKTL